MNKYGDKGSPCRNPLELLKYPEGDPLIIIKNDDVDIHYLIHFLHLSPNPIVFKTIEQLIKGLRGERERAIFNSIFHEILQVELSLPLKKLR